jgi:uncharacterized membrane protein YvbJ
MEKKKEFICQNCGKTVPAHMEKCSHCGRYFKGVRCPKCFYIGESDDFLKGCPSCGYLGDESNNADSSDHNKKSKKPTSIPMWFILFAAIFLTCVIGIFIYIFFHM